MDTENEPKTLPARYRTPTGDIVEGVMVLSPEPVVVEREDGSRFRHGFRTYAAVCPTPGAVLVSATTPDGRVWNDLDNPVTFHPAREVQA